MIHIRDAREEDIPAILAIHNYHIENTCAIWRDEAADFSERFTWFLDRQTHDHPVLIAEADGVVAGYASYSAFRTGSGYNGTVENSIYVDERHQRRGIARQLMSALLDRATAQGRHVMVAGIGLPNDASVALHAQFGFAECGRVKEIGRKFDRWLDLQLMQKIL